MIIQDWQTVCKLTNENGYTQNNTRWEAGTINPKGVLTGEGGLCGRGFYHAYHTPELAAFLNPIGAGFSRPRFWEAEVRGTVEVDTGILKLGVTEMRILREITPIVPTFTQHTAFGIYCASAALAARNMTIPVWEKWRDGWLWEGKRSGMGSYLANRAAAEFLKFPHSSFSATAAAAAADAAYSYTIAASSAAEAAYYTAFVDPAIVLDAITFALSEEWN